MPGDVEVEEGKCELSLHSWKLHVAAVTVTRNSYLVR